MNTKCILYIELGGGDQKKSLGQRKVGWILWAEINLPVKVG